MVKDSPWNCYSWVPKENDNPEPEDSVRNYPAFDPASERREELPADSDSLAENGRVETRSDPDRCGSERTNPGTEKSLDNQNERR